MAPVFSSRRNVSPGQTAERCDVKRYPVCLDTDLAGVVGWTAGDIEAAAPVAAEARAEDQFARGQSLGQASPTCCRDGP